MKYTLSFVCHKGAEIDLQAVLLAASLREFLHVDYELIANVPVVQGKDLMPDDTVLDLLDRLDVRIIETTPILDEYVHSYKIPCLKFDSESQITVVLDSDILLIRPFTDQLHFPGVINVKPDDMNTHRESGTTWADVFDLFSLPFPEKRVTFTLIPEESVPYFNTGVVAVRNDIKQKFAEQWEANCKILFDAQLLTNIHWTDQTAFAVTLHQMNMEYHTLTETYNFPIPYRSGYRRNFYFGHYHWPVSITMNSAVLGVLHRIVKKYPEIREIGERYPKWDVIFDPVIKDHARRLYYTLVPWATVKLRRELSQRMSAQPGQNV